VSTKLLNTLRWAPFWIWQKLTRTRHHGRCHLVVALADHFEPSIIPGPLEQHATLDEQMARLERWCEAYPRAGANWRDHDGRPFVHTYFFPAEQYEPTLISKLAEHCQAGWGEIEIHLHHGIERPDTAENTRQLLTRFRDALVGHGCLSRLDGQGSARYGFVHGNWALANSNSGRACGVDNEMQILAETGCYADFTLPSAPNPAQVRKINALYECHLPLNMQAPHRRGRDLERGRKVARWPLIVQGPLAISMRRRGRAGLRPAIENSEISGGNPATVVRLQAWRNANITVLGRPDWVFLKLHCHGMDPRDHEALLGSPMNRFLTEMRELSSAPNGSVLHFVTAREMVNIALAACDGRDGNPGEYRDYRFRCIAKR
jgi:hypothetical protein